MPFYRRIPWLVLRISDVRMYEDTWMDYVSGAAIDRGKLAHVSHRLPPCDQNHNTHAWLQKNVIFILHQCYQP